MTVAGILSAIIVGAIIGALARLVLPGKQSIGWLLTIVVGIVSAIIGTLIANALGVGGDGGFDFLELLIQIIVAVIGVAIVAGATRRSRV